MSLNGLGQFLVNSAGQPVVSGTTISSTVFNALTADLATALSTAIFKDGQQTITANVPWGGFKITGLGAPTVLGDALSYGRAIVGTGTTTNDDATAGQIGEFISSGVNRGSGSSYTTGVALNITTISLTAGDWDVTAFAGITVTGGTLTQFAGGAGTTSATIPTIGSNGLAQLHAGISITGDDCIQVAGRISLAVTTTIYLIGSPVFSGTAVTYGFIGARRAR